MKAVLRALVRRHLGSEVADRRKQGFTVPVWNWLTTGWRPQLEALGKGTLLEEEGWIRRRTLDQAASAAFSQARAPVQLWTLVVLENWLRSSRTANRARVLS